MNIVASLIFLASSLIDASDDAKIEDFNSKASEITIAQEPTGKIVNDISKTTTVIRQDTVVVPGDGKILPSETGYVISIYDYDLVNCSKIYMSILKNKKEMTFVIMVTSDEDIPDESMKKIMAIVNFFKNKKDLKLIFGVTSKKAKSITKLKEIAPVFLIGNNSNCPPPPPP